jgi:hypothetical protein
MPSCFSNLLDLMNASAVCVLGIYMVVIATDRQTNNIGFGLPIHRTLHLSGRQGI